MVHRLADSRLLRFRAVQAKEGEGFYSSGVGFGFCFFVESLGLVLAVVLTWTLALGLVLAFVLSLVLALILTWALALGLVLAFGFVVGLRVWLWLQC